MNIMNKVTLKGLKKNKTRTIVTIIGVILSTAMITAVTTFIQSLQNYAINYTIAENGDWHGSISNITYDDYIQFKNDTAIDELSLTRNGGFSMLTGSQNEYKPYLAIMEMDSQGLKSLPVNLLYGSLPKNSSELLISEHIISNGGVNYKVGDTLTLEVGQRMLPDGTLVTSNDGMYVEENTADNSEENSKENTDEEAEENAEDNADENADENAEENANAEVNTDVNKAKNEDKTEVENVVENDNKFIEELSITETRTFTITGIIRRLSHDLEPYNAAGYTIITTLDEDMAKESEALRIFIKAKNPKDIYGIVEVFTSKSNKYMEYDYNYELLRFIGASDENTFNAVLYSLAGILISLIMVGSISLIYNSFAISVSERKKLFGLLASTGATAGQRRNSVLFEALVIAAFGIPLGVISGISGIGITLYLIRDLMNSFINNDAKVALTLAVSLPSVVIAVLVALATILISAYIPAMRSKRISAMDAIRQTQDIRLTARKLHTSKLTRKLFGLVGDLAVKNLKRNRKRYRSTVISLFISVVLFVSASSFAMYLEDSVTNVYEDANYDLSYYAGNASEDTKIVKVFSDIMAQESIKQGSIVNITNGTVFIKKEQILNSTYKKMVEFGIATEGDEELATPVQIYSIDHETFTSYINSLGLSGELFLDSEKPAGIIIDRQHFYNPAEERYNNIRLLKDDALQFITYHHYTEEGDAGVAADIAIVASADTTPMGVPEYSYGTYLMLLIDEEQRNTGLSAIPMEDFNTNLYFSSKDPAKSEEEIRNVLLEEGMSISNLYNFAANLQDNRNMILIISVFAYGFITLISLITIANVFNTISTNVNLRRREFAMLKSVGMTSTDFNKMLNYECIFYGLKALTYGLPVSVAVTYLIYRSVNSGVDMQFYVPTHSILISIFSVFFVVFVSMMYSMRKIRKENVLDALKNENL